MKLSEFRVQLDIVDRAAPLRIEDVWRFLVSWERQSEWMLQTKVWTNQASGNDLGPRIIAFTGPAAQRFPISRPARGLRRLGLLDEMLVTQWQPPTYCAVDHVGSLLKGRGDFRLEEIDGGVRFSWFEEVDAPWPVLLLMRPGILVGVHISLRRFRKLLVHRLD